MIDRPYIDVRFETGSIKTVSPVYQYDHGLSLRLFEMDKSKSPQIQFGYNGLAEASSIKGLWEGDIYVTPIPDALLMQEEDLVSYVYTESGNTGMTEQMIRIPIIPREKPTPAYTPEQVDNYGALVIELVDTIEKIETMKREAQEILDRAREAIGVAEAWTNVSATAKTLPTGSEPTVTVTQNAEGQHQIEFGIPMGQTGEQGDTGSGVAPDGKDGQMLVKDGDGDYKTKWQDVPKMVNTINGQWGDITLTNEVISEIYHPPVESVNGMTGEVKQTADSIGALAKDGSNHIASADGEHKAGFEIKDNRSQIWMISKNNKQGIAVDERNTCLYRIDDTGIPKRIVDMDNLPSPAELHAMPDTYKPPVLSVNNKTGHVMITHEDVGARSKGWTPDIDDISGLRKILNEAGKIKTINGNIVPDQNGNVELTPEKLGAADKEHTHEKLEWIDQDVRKTASPKFDVVTANKVIGAVYQ